MRTSRARSVAALLGVPVVLGAGLLTCGAASASPVPTPPPRTRDPLQWPFARTSIWNTPLGTKARYVAAKIRSTGFGLDVDWFVVPERADPAVPVYLSGTSGPVRCAGTRGFQASRTQRLPRSLLIPPTTGNASTGSAFLQPDRRTVVTYARTARCTPGGPLYGLWSGNSSLYGDGIAGGHRGSGLSSIGGSIRAGDLTGSAPIRHALTLDVPSRYLFYDARTGGRRWPALRADPGARRQYRGHVRALRMGSLLALPPSATAARLGVRSAAGRKILAALRNYGAYVVDQSHTDAVNLGVEHGAAVQFRQRTGSDIAAAAGLHADMARIVRALAVVDDNSPSSIGGSGARRTAWAPPLRPSASPARPATAPTATAGATRSGPAPAPSASTISAGPVAEVEAHDAAPAPALWAVAVLAAALLVLGLWTGRRAAGARVIPRGRV